MKVKTEVAGYGPLPDDTHALINVLVEFKAAVADCSAAASATKLMPARAYFFIGHPQTLPYDHGAAAQPRKEVTSAGRSLSVRKRRPPDVHAAKPRGAPDFHR